MEWPETKMGGRSRPSRFRITSGNSERPKAFRRAFAATRIAHDLEGNLLTFLEAADTGTLHSGNMNENILGAVIRLDEAITLGAIEPFHCASGHFHLSIWRCPATTS